MTGVTPPDLRNTRRQGIPGRWVLLAAVPAIALLAILSLVGQPLQTPAAPLGIVSFALAGDLPTARAILAAWDAQARALAAFSLGLDYLFMPAYAIAIALACGWAAGTTAAGGRGQAWQRAGSLLAWGQGLAALLDAVENAALLALLLGSEAAPWPGIAWWCAVPKYLLVAAGLLYAVAGGVRTRRRRATARGAVRPG